LYQTHIRSMSYCPLNGKVPYRVMNRHKKKKWVSCKLKGKTPKFQLTRQTLGGKII